MSEIYQLSYGEILKDLRLYYGYRQKDLSKHLNITSQAYSNYENNKRTPDLETMYQIAHFYHMTVDQLLSYRCTNQISEERNYSTDRSIFRAVDESGFSIPVTAKQAKMLTDILSLSEEQQDACQKLIDFMKKPIS